MCCSGWTNFLDLAWWRSPGLEQAVPGMGPFAFYSSADIVLHKISLYVRLFSWELSHGRAGHRNRNLLKLLLAGSAHHLSTQNQSSGQWAALPPVFYPACSLEMKCAHGQLRISSATTSRYLPMCGHFFRISLSYAPPFLNAGHVSTVLIFSYSVS